MEDFTIVDCQAYIDHYPYGEHIFEVKRHLKKLKSMTADVLKEVKSVSNSSKQKKSSSASHPISYSTKQASQVSQTAKGPSIPRSQTTDSGETQSKNDKVKVILSVVYAWFFYLVVAAVVVLIIYAILPASAGEFILKYIIPIYIGVTILVENILNR